MNMNVRCINKALDMMLSQDRKQCTETLNHCLTEETVHTPYIRQLKITQLNILTELLKW